MKELLSKTEVVAAFTLLGERAHREGIHIELFIVGGVAVIFGHPVAEALREGLTHDIDAVFVRPDGAQLSRVRGLIGQIEQTLKLPAGWLNDSAAKFVTRRSDGPLIHESAGIMVRRATDLQLLGMKLGLERRKTDQDDQEVLFDAVVMALQPVTVDELWSWVAQYVPKERQGPARDSLEELWSVRHA